ncbi:MAG: 50S ribosomal protein L13 [Anaerolineaceae bacterium]|nr:50S ribosomal protein L13 [Anaerolineaceae bacterium]
MEKTYVIKGKKEAGWVLVDANEKNLGRLATQIAHYLLGKHKPDFTPGVEMGDFVVVINAEKLAFTQKKLDSKKYYRHSGYPGGLKTMTLREMLDRHPERVLEKAVWGMLPKNKLGRKLMTRVKIYTGNEHPHEAQYPKPVA